METDPNPMPKIDILPRLERAGAFVSRVLRFLPLNAPDHMSDHYRGGAAMLDRELYDRPAQLELDYGREE